MTPIIIPVNPFSLMADAASGPKGDGDKRKKKDRNKHRNRNEYWNNTKNETRTKRRVGKIQVPGVF